MNQDTEFQNLFDEVGNDPLVWSQKALALLQSAEILRASFCATKSAISNETEASHRMDLQQIFVMLRGMGVECLLKAAIIKNVKPLAVQGRLQSPVSATPHDLIPLEKCLDEITKTGLSLDERMVLARMSKQIVMGRYPTETKVRKSPTLPAGAGPP